MDCTKAEDAETTPAGHCQSARWAERPALSRPVMDGFAAALYAKRLLMYDTAADSEQASSGIALVLNDEYNENLFMFVKRTPAWNGGGGGSGAGGGERGERGGWVEFGSVLLGCGSGDSGIMLMLIKLSASPGGKGGGEGGGGGVGGEEGGCFGEGGKGGGRGGGRGGTGGGGHRGGRGGEAGGWGGCGGDGGGGGGGGGEGGAAARAGRGEERSWRVALGNGGVPSRPDQARSVGEEVTIIRTIKLQMSAQQWLEGSLFREYRIRAGLYRPCRGRTDRARKSPCAVLDAG